MARLAVQLLGPYRATLDREPISGFVSNKARALLAYLIVEADRPHSREKVAGLLWPGFTESSARTSLRRALANLRQVTCDRQAETPFIFSSRQTIQFNRESDHFLDVSTFCSLVEGNKGRPVKFSRLEDAVEHYQGHFLEGFSIPDSQAFETWALIIRQSLQEQALQALQRLATHYEEQGIYDRGLFHAQHQLRLDPYDENAHQQLMRLLALSGQRNQALVHYQHLCQLLEQDLGVMPSVQTQEVYQWLLANEIQPAVPAEVVEISTYNLPAQITSFVGRKREITQLEQLLGTSRLLTLTGPPGTGKTRLALEVASRVTSRFPDGVCFVELAPIRDPQLLSSTIAKALGIREISGQPLLNAVKKYLNRKLLLLLLDNFEQISDAAPLLSDLLSASSGLKALVTSREPLHIYGEQEYSVPPLSTLDPDQIKSLSKLSQSESVELFVQRAQAVNLDFLITKENVRDIAEICVRLDGLPLAIELAAARSKLLSPAMIRKRLGNRLNMLTSGSRDLPARLRSLQAAIDWSYDLLDQDEKRLFARLSVFQGGRALEAVENVCGHDLLIDAFTGLESLTDKSLLQKEIGPKGELRFIMLETIHEYARKRLDLIGEVEVIQKRHARFFVTLAEQAEIKLVEASADNWYARLRAEHDNLRTALEWSIDKGDKLLALRLVGSLRDFWYCEGYIAEGLMWAERALNCTENAPPDLRAKTLNTAGLLAFAQGDMARSKQLHLEALALSRQSEDSLNRAWSLAFLAIDATGFPEEYDEGIAYCEEALALFQKSGNMPGIIQALTGLGELARLVGDYKQASDAYEKCLTVCRETGHRWREAMTLSNLAYIAQHQGDHERAEALLLEDLSLMRVLKLDYLIASGLPMLAGPTEAKGEPMRAARLLGASEALLEPMGASILPADQIEVDRYVATIRKQLGEDAFTAAWAEGRAMTLEEVIAYALNEDREFE